nr:hypothetical protein [Lysinibacillus timonensis]
MNDQFKKELEKIELPKELQERVKRGVEMAKLEDSNLKHQSNNSKPQFKPLLISLLAVAVIGILLFPALQSMDSGNGHSQGTIVYENLVDGDSNVTEEMDQIISNYIIQQYQRNGFQPSDVQFEVHKVYGSLKGKDTITIYLWSYYSSFNKVTGNEGVSGSSLPVTITLQEIDGNYKVINYQEAQDGSLYVKSIENMFPEEYVEEVLQQPSNMGELEEEMQQKVNEWLKDEEEKSIVNSSDIELTKEEEEVYNKFQQDLNVEHLRELDPKSVAKLYVLAGFEGKYDIQYALYTDREERIMWSKEEHLNIPESERGSIEHYEELYNIVYKGTFVQTSENEGYIKYGSGEDMQGFQMFRNEDGIWQVSFIPIQ